MFSTIRLDLDEDHIPEFTRVIEGEMNRKGGVIRIKKDSGIFVAKNHAT